MLTVGLIVAALCCTGLAAGASTSFTARYDGRLVDSPEDRRIAALVIVCCAYAVVSIVVTIIEGAMK